MEAHSIGLMSPPWRLTAPAICSLQWRRPGSTYATLSEGASMPLGATAPGNEANSQYERKLPGAPSSRGLWAAILLEGAELDTATPPSEEQFHEPGFPVQMLEGLEVGNACEEHLVGYSRGAKLALDERRQLSLVSLELGG